MGRFVKLLLVLVLLGLIGLIGYSYSGLMQPEMRDISQPVVLDAN